MSGASRAAGATASTTRPARHDDVANAVAGLAAIVHRHGSYDTTYRAWNDCTDDDPDGARAWRRAQLHSYLRSCGMPNI